MASYHENGSKQVGCKMPCVGDQEEQQPGAIAGVVSTPETRRMRIRDRQAKQQALMRAATRLFAQRGYEATTTREIAAAAGCAEGLIHRYFRGKAGLLFSLIQSRVSQEVEDLSERLALAPTLEEEFVQLVNWEVDCMWEDRDFLRVMISRALLDPAHGRLLNKIGSSRHAPAIAKRLRKFPECDRLKASELEALSDFIKVIGMMYGFVKPIVMRCDRQRAKEKANIVARVLARVCATPGV